MSRINRILNLFSQASTPDEEALKLLEESAEGTPGKKTKKPVKKELTPDEEALELLKEHGGEQLSIPTTAPTPDEDALELLKPTSPAEKSKQAPTIPTAEEKEDPGVAEIMRMIEEETGGDKGEPVTFSGKELGSLMKGDALTFSFMGRRYGPGKILLKSCPVCGYRNNLYAEKCKNCELVYKQVLKLAEEKGRDLSKYKNLYFTIKELWQDEKTKLDQETIHKIYKSEGVTPLSIDHAEEIDPEDVTNTQKMEDLMYRLNAKRKPDGQIIYSDETGLPEIDRKKVYRKTSNVASMLGFTSAEFLAAVEKYNQDTNNKFGPAAQIGLGGKEYQAIWNWPKAKAIFKKRFIEQTILKLENKIEKEKNKIAEGQISLAYYMKRLNKVKNSKNFNEAELAYLLKARIDNLKGAKVEKLEAKYGELIDLKREINKKISDAEKELKYLENALEKFKNKEGVKEKTEARENRYLQLLKIADQIRTSRIERVLKIATDGEQLGLFTPEEKTVDKDEREYVEEIRNELDRLEQQLGETRTVSGRQTIVGEMNKLKLELERILPKEHAQRMNVPETGGILNLEKKPSTEIEIGKSVLTGLQSQDTLVRVKNIMIEWIDPETKEVYSNVVRQYRDPETGDIIKDYRDPEEAAAEGLEMRKRPFFKNKIVTIYSDDNKEPKYAKCHNISISYKETGAEGFQKIPTNHKVFYELKDAKAKRLKSDQHTEEEKAQIKKIPVNKLYEVYMKTNFPDEEAWDIQRGKKKKLIRSKTLGKRCENGPPGLIAAPFTRACIEIKWVLGMENPPRKVQLMDPEEIPQNENRDNRFAKIFNLLLK